MSTIALIRERKQPADHRVALSPDQVKQALNVWPQIKVLVERSAERVFLMRLMRHMKKRGPFWWIMPMTLMSF
jgi:hypothetical protein